MLDREEDDSRDHHEVEVAVRVAGEGRLLGPRRPPELLLDHDRDPVEVRPPERGRDGHPEDCRRDHTRRERNPRRSDSEGDDRLADGDDHDQAVPLGEVAGREAPSLPTAHDHAEVVDRERGDPQSDLDLVILDEACGDDEDGADRRGRHHPKHSAEEVVDHLVPQGRRGQGASCGR